MLFRRPTLLKLELNLNPVISPTLFRLGPLFPGHPTTRMFNLWTLTFMICNQLNFLPSLLNTSSPSRLPSNRILNPTTRNITQSRSTLKRCVLKPKSILTRGITRYGQNVILSRLLQRKMSPLPQLKSLLNLNIRLLRSLNIRIAQIQSFTGK